MGYYGTVQQTSSTVLRKSKCNSNFICIRWPRFIEVREFCPKASVFLIGTRSDLWNPEKEGEITQAQIDEVANQIQAYKTILCSARKNENICDIFELSIKAYLAKN